MENSELQTWVRRRIYNRWFYAFLTVVCLLGAAADLADLIAPGESLVLNAISLLSSAVAALLTALVFLDLHFRR